MVMIPPENGYRMQFPPTHGGLEHSKFSTKPEDSAKRREQTVKDSWSHPQCSHHKQPRFISQLTKMMRKPHQDSRGVHSMIAAQQLHESIQALMFAASVDITSHELQWDHIISLPLMFAAENAPIPGKLSPFLQVGPKWESNGLSFFPFPPLSPSYTFWSVEAEQELKLVCEF